MLIQILSLFWLWILTLSVFINTKHNFPRDKLSFLVLMQMKKIHITSVMSTYITFFVVARFVLFPGLFLQQYLHTAQCTLLPFTPLLSSRRSDALLLGDGGHFFEELGEHHDGENSVFGLRWDGGAWRQNDIPLLRLEALWHTEGTVH